MADEEIKKTTPKKRTTTSKAKADEQPTQESTMEQMQLQMQQMMAMMMAQQQQLMELMQSTQQVEKQVIEVEKEEEKIKPYKPKKVRKEDKLNKQQLRRKYKEEDIYVMNVSQGMVIYHGRNNVYEWQNPGDVEVMTIDDIINMPRSYLHSPWVVLDAYENEGRLIDDICDVLGLNHIYEYITTLQDMEEDINEVELEDIKRAIQLSKQHGYDITVDMAVLVQRKIHENELTNYHVIAELSKLLGRKFM